MKKVLEESVQALEANRDEIQASVHKAMLDVDLPLPDNMEKPLDEFLEQSIMEVFDMVVSFLKAITASS